MTVATIPELIIPDREWSMVRGRVNAHWDARECPHHTIMGQTRSGKSYLIRHGILPLCHYDRVLILDAKGNDPTLTGLGRPVDRIPNKGMRGIRQMVRDKKPRDNWYRLMIVRGYDAGHDQVGEALERVYNEGDWIVVVDELRHLVDSRYPGIGLRNEWEELMLRGGSRGVAMINASQEPKWLPSSYYTQGSFYWISRIEDESVQKRIAEIGSSRALMPHLQAIPKRRWIAMDNLEDERFWSKTVVKKGQ